MEELNENSVNFFADQNPDLGIERWENEGGAIRDLDIHLHPVGSASKTIYELISKLNKADNEGNLETILECYTDTVVWYPPDGTVTKGVEEVRNRYKTLFDRFWLDFWVVIDETKFGRYVGYCHGQTKGKMVAKNTGDKVEINDNFIMTLLYSELGWRISTLMWVHK